MNQNAVAVTTAWKGSAQAVYLRQANALYAAMDRPESDLEELSRRIEQSRNALSDLVANCRGYTSG
jgi:uncharacterized protein YukE